MTRRTALAVLGASLARAAGRIPANKNLKWALGANLWNSFPRVPFTDILDIMRDTGFIGIRLTQFPQILKTYDITAAQVRAECEKRGCHVITISFNGPTYDPARHKEVIASAKTAMTFLKDFGAEHLVVFPPNRTNLTEAGFKAMCDCFNLIGETANSMGFKAGLHNHMNEMVQTAEEIDRCMATTDPKLFHFSPDTAHLYLADCDVAKTLEKHKARLMLLDYKDARHVTGKITDDVFDLGDGAVDFPACHRVLKSINFKGWLCVDLDVARKGPRTSYERCAEYVVNKLEPIYV
ncbi:MAG TPA: TIM barrel protein [Candidatus Acidoferrales bacterium]|nr:TIM barrel protein [Candidatus Acidoferrales bacterium]